MWVCLSGDSTRLLWQASSETAREHCESTTKLQQGQQLLACWPHDDCADTHRTPSVSVPGIGHPCFSLGLAFLQEAREDQKPKISFVQLCLLHSESCVSELSRALDSCEGTSFVVGFVKER